MPKRFPIIAVSIAVALLPTAGCDVYDEPVRPAVEPTTPSAWPSLADGGGTGPRSTGIEYVEGYAAAVARAAAEGKPLFVLCRAGWCRWCGEMTAKVLADAPIVARSRKFICVCVDADRDADICRSLDVRGYPTVLLLSADGRELSRRTGRISSKSLAALLDGVGDATEAVATPGPSLWR